MKITKEMIDPKFFEELGILEELKEVPKKTTEREGGIGEGGISQYMEYPSSSSKRRFVMQDHWRGRSVHLDFRMEMNDHLVGWTILDNPPESPEVKTVEEAKRAQKNLDWGFSWANQAKGLRAETKARQPKEWRTVQGIVPPGGVGATKEFPGVLVVKEQGTFWEGTQKPYFHEYFIKSTVGNIIPKNQWVRIIVRGIRVKKLDPETKKPLPGKYEMMWRAMIPSDQTAYALKRGIKKGWKPPKEVIPIPPDQRKGELWEKWQDYMKGIKPEKEEKVKSFEGLPFADYKNFADCVKKNQDKDDPKAYCAAIARKVGEIPSKDYFCEDCINFETCSDFSLPTQLACEKYKEKKEENLVKGKFTLHFHSWMGQIVVRAIPHVEYYLRLEYGGNVRSWYLNNNPTRIRNLAAVSEGNVNKKWMTFEGEIKPGQEYNPTKTLVSQMVIIDTGPVDIQSKIEDGKEILLLKFIGKSLKGNWLLEQEEKGSDIYVLERTDQEKLAEGEFVLHRHYWDNKQHWDIRVRLTENPKKLVEWNLWKNPLKVEEEEPIKALVKVCEDPEKWFITRGKGVPRKAYGKQTYVDVLDTGTLNIIEATSGFMSMKFKGEKLKGYWILKKDQEDKWYFEKAKLPEAHSLSGNPKEGDYYKPFLIEKKKGWNYYWIRLYDIRKFTRCEKDWKKYLPNLSLPDYIEDILVCLYPKPGTLHHARITAVKVKGETSLDQVSKWIKSQDLHTWDKEMIRDKSEK